MRCAAALAARQGRRVDACRLVRAADALGTRTDQDPRLAWGELLDQRLLAEVDADVAARRDDGQPLDVDAAVELARAVTRS